MIPSLPRRCPVCLKAVPGVRPWGAWWDGTFWEICPHLRLIRSGPAFFARVTGPDGARVEVRLGASLPVPGLKAALRDMRRQYPVHEVLSC